MVIVGGSIAGLSLALALERSGIDFVVLEAHPTIAPQVGASIAVLPSGARILDQLGCYDDVASLVNCSIDNFIIRDAGGQELIRVENLEEHLVQRLVAVPLLSCPALPCSLSFSGLLSTAVVLLKADSF